MTVLLTGRGVEDCRSVAWGVVVASLQTQGYEVQRFDPFHAVKLASNDPIRQVEWLLSDSSLTHVVCLRSGHELETRIIELAAQRGVESHVIDIQELTASPGTPGALSPMVAALKESTPFSVDINPVDILLVGDCTESRIDVVASLRNSNRSVRVYGDGWSTTPHEDITMSPVPYGLLAEVIASANTFGMWRSTEVGEAVGPLHALNLAQKLGLRIEAVDGTRIDGHSESSSWELYWPTLVPRPRGETIQVHNPLVSYITAAYNVENYIGPAIDSLLSQTVEDIEVIVVIDGESDRSGEIARQRANSDARVKIVEQSNAGQTGRFDWIFGSGLRHARGRYVGTLGGDDIASPDRTERSLDVFRNDPGVSVVHGGGYQIDANGMRHNTLFTPTMSYDTTSLLRRALGCNPVADPTALIDRKALEAVGSYTNGFVYDYATWMKLAGVGRFRYLPNPLIEYRIHDSNSSVGAGHQRALDNGRLLRETQRRRTTIFELYPALQNHEPDKRALAAAFTDLGNMWLRYEPLPEAAIAEFESAISVCDDAIPMIHVCMAYAHRLLGNHNYADEILQRAVEREPQLGAFAGRLLSAGLISSAPFIPTTLSNVKFWDGTDRSLKRILLIADWQRIDTWYPVVDSYLRTHQASTPVDLVLVPVNCSSAFVVEQVMNNFGSSPLLESGPSITIEDWTELALIPLDRFASVIDARQGVHLGEVNISLNAAVSNEFVATSL